MAWPLAAASSLSFEIIWPTQRGNLYLCPAIAASSAPDFLPHPNL